MRLDSWEMLILPVFDQLDPNFRKSMMDYSAGFPQRDIALIVLFFSSFLMPWIEKW